MINSITIENFKGISGDISFEFARLAIDLLRKNFNDKMGFEFASGIKCETLIWPYNAE